MAKHLSVAAHDSAHGNQGPSARPAPTPRHPANAHRDHSSSGVRRAVGRGIALSPRRQKQACRSSTRDACVGRAGAARVVPRHTPAYVRGMRASAAGCAERARLVLSGRLRRDLRDARNDAEAALVRAMAIPSSRLISEAGAVRQGQPERAGRNEPPSRLRRRRRLREHSRVGCDNRARRLDHRSGGGGLAMHVRDDREIGSRGAVLGVRFMAERDQSAQKNLARSCPAAPEGAMTRA